MEKFKENDKIVIATTTFYPGNSESDKVRKELAKKTIIESAKRGYEIVVVDGGSSPDFLKEISTLGAKVMKQERAGLGESRREAFRAAFETKREIIIWMEPEKYTFISQIEKTARAILEENADMVIPKRKSLSSYPISQQYAEPLGNLFWKELTGADLDIWVGIRVFKREIADYFIDYHGDYGDKWDSIVMPVMIALHKKKKVFSVEIDYMHPAEQTKNEEHSLDFIKKRVEQLHNLTFPLEDYWKKLKAGKI